MSLAEKAVKEVATRTPERYAGRVRLLAFVYFALNLTAVAIVVLIVWRAQFFVSLAQRSNIETLTLAIILILCVFYIVSTFKGFIGAVRMFWLNAGAGNREPRKQAALSNGGTPIYVCFDKAVCLKGKPVQEITWEVGDSNGKLGDMVLDGVKATYMPEKEGINSGIFDFLADQIENILRREDEHAQLNIVQWASIDEDRASAYYSMVRAFQNLGTRLDDKKPVWPTVEITQEDVDAISREFRRLVPTLRSESFLPDLEFEVEYNVPILPEPLGLLRLTRRDSRADPVFTMGCAGMIMLSVMLVLTLIVLLPPWVPSK